MILVWKVEHLWKFLVIFPPPLISRFRPQTATQTPFRIESRRGSLFCFRIDFANKLLKFEGKLGWMIIPFLPISTDSSSFWFLSKYWVKTFPSLLSKTLKLNWICNSPSDLGERWTAVVDGCTKTCSFSRSFSFSRLLLSFSLGAEFPVSKDTKFS